MKNPKLMIGGIILIILLAGAAFVGARMLNGQELPGISPGMFLGGGNSNGVRIDRGEIQPLRNFRRLPRM